MKIIRHVFTSTLFVLIILLTLTACQKQQSEAQKQKTVIAKKQPISSSLFFPGTLLPIDTKSVTSPVDGRVEAVKFNYGERVIKDAPLILIDSNDLADKFRKAVSDYLQQKSALNTSKTNYEGDSALYKAGVISQQTYLSTKDTYENTVLRYYQSRYDLNQILEKASIDPKQIEKLTIEQTEAVNKILNRRFDNVVVKAPASGVALFPVPDQSDSNSTGDNKDSGKLHIGSSVKDGQLLLQIGDLSGLRATININEVNINQLKSGMTAIITGDAFPGIVLSGKIESVSSQAKPDAGVQGQLAEFTAMIVISTVPEAAAKLIRVGMTAKIQIEIKQDPQIVLPMSAIKTINNQPNVVILKDGVKKTVPVVVGNTTPTGIIVIQGVSEGDEVVVNDQI